MLVKNNVVQSDRLGAFASGLCLIHCIATPFIFVAHTCSASCSGSPMWWSAIDFLFIGISFFAIYWSVKTTSKDWMKYALWSSWAVLLFIILNERVALLPLPEFSIYIPALALISLHLYNQRYCQCTDDECAVPA